MEVEKPLEQEHPNDVQLVTHKSDGSMQVEAKTRICIGIHDTADCSKCS
jgi:hypothetical protein